MQNQIPVQPLCQHALAANDKTACEEKINNGRILPATRLFVHINLFVLALGITAYLIAGLLVLFPWHNIVLTAVLLSLLPLFMFLTFWSLNGIRRSIRDVMWSENPNNYMRAVHLAGYVITAKNIHKVLNGFSVVYACFSILWFCVANTKSEPFVDRVMGYVCVIAALYILAVSIDVRRANTR